MLMLMQPWSSSVLCRCPGNWIDTYVARFFTMACGQNQCMFYLSSTIHCLFMGIKYQCLRDQMNVDAGMNQEVAQETSDLH